MTSLKEFNVPNVSTRAAKSPFDMNDDDLDVIDAMLDEPQKPAARIGATDRAELFTVDLLGSWLKP